MSDPPRLCQKFPSDQNRSVLHSALAYATSAGTVNRWHDGYVPDKPTSEQIRGKAEKLRETAIKLIEHAKTIGKVGGTEKANFLSESRQLQTEQEAVSIGKGKPPSGQRAFMHVTLKVSAAGSP